MNTGADTSDQGLFNGPVHSDTPCTKEMREDRRHVQNVLDRDLAQVEGLGVIDVMAALANLGR